MSHPSRRAALAVLAAAAGSLRPRSASAQAAAQQVRVRGTIAVLQGEILTVTTRDGGRAEIALPDAASVSALRRVPVSEIVPGTLLGVVAEPGVDGELRAVAITVLPPTATRQFQAPWDLGPDSTMNNGPVSAVAQASDGHVLTLSIQGRDVRVQVDAQSALVQPVAAGRADLKPGAAVFVAATRGDDGKLTATRVAVERDGVVPPT